MCMHSCRHVSHKLLYNPLSCCKRGSLSYRERFIWRVVVQGNTLAKIIANSEQQQSPQHQDQRQDERLLRRQAKTVKVIFIIVVVFLISWYPIYTLNTVAFFCRKCCISQIPYDVTILLSHYNSVCNPILYGWTMQDFRFAIKTLIFGPQFKMDSSAGTWW